MTIYFTADLHFGHANIIKHQNRPWDSVEAMNRALVHNINTTVDLNDDLYILGDFSFTIKQTEAIRFREAINCRRVTLIKGNHDCGWNGVKVFKEVCDYKELKTDERKIVLSHYPFLSWNGQHRGSIMLHGHIHNNVDYNTANIEAGLLRFDVGVDANDYKPVSLDEILEWAELAKKSPDEEEIFGPFHTIEEMFASLDED